MYLFSLYTYCDISINMKILQETLLANIIGPKVAKHDSPMRRVQKRFTIA